MTRQIRRLQQRLDTAEGHIAVLEAQVSRQERQRAPEPERVTIAQASAVSDPWRSDPDHSPEAMAAIKAGNLAELAEIRARAQAAEAAGRRQPRSRKMWDLGSGRAYLPDEAATEQRSLYPGGSFWARFPEHMPAEDPERVAAALERHEAWKAGMLRQDAVAQVTGEAGT